MGSDKEYRRKQQEKQQKKEGKQQKKQDKQRTKPDKQQNKQKNQSAKRKTTEQVDPGPVEEEGDTPQQVWKLFPVLLFLQSFDFPVTYFANMRPDRLYHKIWDTSFSAQRSYVPMEKKPVWLLPGRCHELWGDTMGNSRFVRTIPLRYKGDDALRTFLENRTFTETEKQYKRVRPSMSIDETRELIYQLRAGTHGNDNSKNMKRSKTESAESGSTLPLRSLSKTSALSSDQSRQGILFRSCVGPDASGSTFFKLLILWPYDLGSEADVQVRWLTEEGKHPVLRVQYPPKIPAFPSLEQARVVETNCAGPVPLEPKCLDFSTAPSPAGREIFVAALPGHPVPCLEISYHIIQANECRVVVKTKK